MACGACGKRIPVGEPHPCFDKAVEAQKERAAGKQLEPVEHVRSTDRYHHHPGAFPYYTPPPSPPRFTGRGGRGELALYVDKTKRNDGTHGEHLCLCEICASAFALGTIQRKLAYLVTLTGPKARDTAVWSADAASDWDWNDVIDGGAKDGCEWCGHLSENRRTEPTERFYILYIQGSHRNE